MYDITRRLFGKYVDTFAFADGRFEVHSKGSALSYNFFGLDQRVTHTAITNNKRLGAVLEHIIQMQNTAPLKPKERTKFGKMGYKPRERKPVCPSGSRAKKKQEARSKKQEARSKIVHTAK